MNTACDIAIVGGGMVGLTLAALLREQGLKLLLLDADAPPRDDLPLQPDRYQPRVSALSLASQQLLERVGAWPLMRAQRVSPYQRMVVWDGEGSGQIEFDAAAIQQPALGHIVENEVTRHALLTTLADQHGVELRWRSPVTALGSTTGGRPLLQLEDGSTVTAQLLVAADGSHSPLRQMAGFRCRQWSYRQRAIVSTVRSTQPHAATAWQCFRDGAPLALLPLSDPHHCSIVWSLPEPAADSLLASDEASFNQALTRASEARLGALELADRRYSFPLRQSHSVDYVQGALVLIGDAAHSIHPLAGQGVNLGLLDAAVLAEELGKGVARGLPLNDPLLLQRYQRRRQGENLAMMAAMEGLKRLFAADPLPLRLLRNRGLSLVDRSAPLKRWLIGRASGMAGDLPDIARAVSR